MCEVYVFKLLDREGETPRDYWEPRIDAVIKQYEAAGDPNVTTRAWYGNDMFVLAGPTQTFVDQVRENLGALAVMTPAQAVEDLPAYFRLAERPILQDADVYDDDGEVIGTNAEIIGEEVYQTIVSYEIEASI